MWGADAYLAASDSITQNKKIFKNSNRNNDMCMMKNIDVSRQLGSLTKTELKTDD